MFQDFAPPSFPTHHLHVSPGEHASQMDAHHKAAFELLGPGGKVTEAAVLEALLHGHEKMLGPID